MQGVRWTEEDLKVHQARRAVPAAPASVPADAVQPQRKPRLREEDDLQQAVAHLLDTALPRDHRWWHTPNGGKRNAATAAILKSFGAKPGIADVLIVRPDTRLVWIELKASKGVLSEGQKGWRDWCQTIGMPWFLCRSVDDVIAACADAGVPLRVRAQ